MLNSAKDRDRIEFLFEVFEGSSNSDIELSLIVKSDIDVGLKNWESI